MQNIRNLIILLLSAMVLPLWAQHRISGCELVKGTQTIYWPELEVKSGGHLINAGTIHYKGVTKLINDGGFAEQGNCMADYSSTCSQSAGSSGDNHFDQSVASTTISGSMPVRMLQVTLDRAIELDNEWQLAGTLTWTSGMITTPRAEPAKYLHFLSGSSFSEATASRHVDGYAAWSGGSELTMPIGSGSKLGRLGLTGTCGVVYKAAYFNGNPSAATLPLGAPFSGTSLEAGLLHVSSVEYWDVDGIAPTKLTLHFDEDSGLSALAGSLSELVIAGWDGMQWVNLGNTATTGTLMGTGSITSETLTPDEYQAYTFGYYCPPFTSGAISTTGETICYGGTAVEIGSVTPASGGDGHIEYSWRSSADNFATAIVGATGASYTPASGLTETTSYRRYAADGACNTTPEVSMGEWTVTVSPHPGIVCPADMLVHTSSDGMGDCTGLASWHHPMELAGACAPLMLSLQIEDEPVQTVTPGASFSAHLSVGLYTLDYMLSDAGGNTATCSFTIAVADDEQPVLHCVTGYEATLNGESSVALLFSDLGSVSDNCIDVQTMVSPSVLTTAQFGQLVPVQVMAVDASGNSSVCIVPVTLRGTPPGWRHTSGSVGPNCASSLSYDLTSGVWTATATNCNYGSPYQQDAMMFAQRTLCGDGSITAHLSGLHGASAFAGLIMRESNAVGSRKVQLMVNRNSNLARREIRYQTGEQAFPSDFSNPASRSWLRIVRTGHIFRGYTSSDGISWWFVMQVHVPMNSCIELGMVLTNMQTGVTSTATFAGVQVVGSGGAPTAVTVGGAMATDMEVRIYPNPATTELVVELPELEGISAYALELYDMRGLLQMRRDGEQVIDVRALPAGVYVLRVISEGRPELIRRVVIGTR